MSGEKRLECPGCGGPLREVYAAANYGRVLLLDQCGDCGGVWFDRWELYFIGEEGLKSLHAVDITSLNGENPARKGDASCPKCEKALVPFIDPNLPKDASIMRCTGCGGVWLNRGDLPKYAGHKASFNKGNTGREVDMETLKRLQSGLKAGSAIAPPTTEELALKTDDSPPEPREIAGDVAILILQSLLRLIFKF